MQRRTRHAAPAVANVAPRPCIATAQPREQRRSLVWPLECFGGRISKQRVAAVAAPPRQEPASSAGAARTGTVLLVESPAKAKKIQQYLGDQYTARPCPRALRSCF